MIAWAALYSVIIFALGVLVGRWTAR